VVVNDSTGRAMPRHSLHRVAGVKNLREIRGCEAVHVERSPFQYPKTSWLNGPRYTIEQFESFQSLLRKQLCQGREQVREVIERIIVKEDE